MGEVSVFAAESLAIRESARREPPVEDGKMLWIWTPQRLRLAVYAIAAYLALC